MSEEHKDQETTETQEIKKWIKRGAIVIIGLWLANWLLLFFGDEASRGTTGDMFGVVNALFSGFAFLGIIYTILLQREELKLQRKELRDTRKEFEIQNETLKIQRFENTLFNMLSFLNELVGAIEYSRSYHGFNMGSKTYSYAGRHALKKLTIEMLNSSEAKDVNKVYSVVNEEISSYIDHYIRKLFNIIRLVGQTELSIKDKTHFRDTYLDIIRSQLSSDELVWIFYHSLCINTDIYKPLIEKHALLKDLDIDRIKNKEHLALYELSAYGLPDNK